MRNLLFLLLLGLGLASCTSSNSDSFEINGSIPKAAGKIVYLADFNDSGIVILDSLVSSEKGEFAFKGKLQEPVLYYVGLSKFNLAPIVLEKGAKVNCSFEDTANLGNKYTIKGSEGSKRLMEFFESFQEVQKKVADLQKKMQQAAGSPSFDSVQNSVQNEYAAIYKNQTEKVKKMIASADTGVVAINLGIYALNMLNPVEEKEYFDQLYKHFKEKSAPSRYFKSFEKMYKVFIPASPVNQNEQTPEIELPDPKGNVVKLSSLRGKVVVIDFWASWCKPCRAESPAMVKLYKDFHDKGLEIYSVSLDKNKADWEKAIADDGLNWIHVSDLQFWNSAAAKAYGVNSIPATFLLSTDGRLVSSGLRGQDLYRAVSMLCK